MLGLFISIWNDMAAQLPEIRKVVSLTYCMERHKKWKLLRPVLAPSASQKININSEATERWPLDSVFWLEERFPQHTFTPSIHQICYCSLTNVWKNRVEPKNSWSLESISCIEANLQTFPGWNCIKDLYSSIMTHFKATC